MDDGYLRIGEFSERVGVSPDLLRAWERRYGLLQPDRSDGGFRLYSDADATRVERMTALMEDGLSAAEAARLAVSGAMPPSTVEQSSSRGGYSLSAASDRLRTAIDHLDEASLHSTIDELLTAYDLETVLRDVLLPYLREVGERWAAGELSVGQEHFASNLIRARLLAVGRGWGRSAGPGAVLAAPPGEEHDLGLITFGLALWRRGWRITFLGADTPAESLREVVGIIRTDLVVVAALEPDPLLAIEADLTELASSVRVAIGGGGASDELAERIGAELLEADPLAAASAFTPGRSRP
jgi:MerR family transcriptional regulator, light-induced transcriptional regulator